jgi:hypothetical protein
MEPYRLSARLRIQPHDPVSPVKRVGQELREARQRNGKELVDVWRALKIRPNFLAAIEEGQFEDLPGRAFTIGYVGRYARYLQLDVENLQKRLKAEIAARGGIFSDHIDIEPLPRRRFPVVGIAIAGLLLAALIYSRDDVMSFAARSFEQVTEEGFAQKLVDALAPGLVEQQTQVAAPEPLTSVPFEVAAAKPVPLRAEPLPPIPVIAVTQPVSVRPELLPPIPVIDVTRAVAVRTELLPPLPVIAVTQPVPVRAEFLSPIPVIAVTQPVPVRAEFLPPLPVIDVTRAVAVRAEFLPPIPVIAVTRPVSLRADLTPEAMQQRSQAQLPPGRRYGLQNRSSRITLRVHSPTIVAIRDSRNQVFIDRWLAPGDTYRVPNRVGLWLTAIDASAVEIVLDGASVGFAGTQPATVRDLSLDPRSIANRARRAGAQAER